MAKQAKRGRPPIPEEQRLEKISAMLKKDQIKKIEKRAARDRTTFGEALRSIIDEG